MTRLVVGCNYHTTWQRHPGMRFVLSELSKDKTQAKLSTRNTKKEFWCKVSDLIFIESVHNKQKADKIEKGLKNAKQQN